MLVNQQVISWNEIQPILGQRFLSTLPENIKETYFSDIDLKYRSEIS